MQTETVYDVSHPSAQTLICTEEADPKLAGGATIRLGGKRVRVGIVPVNMVYHKTQLRYNPINNNPNADIVAEPLTSESVNYVYLQRQDGEEVALELTGRNQALAKVANNYKALNKYAQSVTAPTIYVTSACFRTVYEGVISSGFGRAYTWRVLRGDPGYAAETLKPNFLRRIAKETG